VTTRTSAIRVTTTGADQPPLVVTIKVPFPSTVIACLPISYLNHAFSLLSATQIQRLQTTLQSCTSRKLSDILDNENWPVRMTGRTEVISMVSCPYNTAWLVSKDESHTDLVKILPEGLGIRVYPSNPELGGEDVLTEGDLLVQSRLLTSGEPFRIVELVRVVQSTRSKADKRRETKARRASLP
jgi:hypothetical protein